MSATARGDMLAAIPTQAAASDDSSRRRHRCIFLVHHAEAADAILDVYFEMARSIDFEPIVLSIPRRFPGSSQFGDEVAVHRGLTAAHVPHIRFHVQDDLGCGQLLRLLQPDFVFRQSPWDNDIQPGFATGQLAFTRLCYIPYAMPIITRYLVDAQAQAPGAHDHGHFLRACWRIFCETRDSRQLFEPHADSDRLSVTGSPKFDRLAKACRADPHWPIETTSSQKPYRIIWAPHHSIGPDWLGFGVFVGLVGEMVKWLASDPGIEVVLKPHPALFDQLKNVGAEELARQFLDCWAKLPNTAIAEGGDYGPLFAGSDAMITDGISFLVEYQFAGKPLIFVDSGRHVPFNAAGTEVLAGIYSVSSFAELHATVSQLRSGTQDHLAPRRRAIVADYLQADGESATRVLDELRRSVAAEVAAPEEANMPTISVFFGEAM